MTYFKKDWTEKVRQFCRPTDELICIRIFKRSDNICCLCCVTPLNWHHVLLNTATNECIDLDLPCVVAFKKIMESLGSRKKIIFFPRYKKEVEYINTINTGTADLLEFSASLTVMKMLLARPGEINYKTLKAILSHTHKFISGEENELFHRALDIYVDREYYIYDSLNDKQEGDDVEKRIEEYMRMEAELDVEKYAHEDYCLSSEVSFADPDECTPEGLGAEEIDWESHDKDD